MKRVLVTRPKDCAKKTAKHLLACGYNPIIFPLSRMAPLHPSPLNLNTINVTAVTSANAIRYACDSLLSFLIKKPLYVVGKRTEQIAKEAGFSNVFSGNRDVNILASLMGNNLAPHSHVAYLCGRVRRSDLETVLVRQGHQVSIIETYDTLPLHYKDIDLLSATQDVPLDAILVYSSGGAEILKALISCPLLEKFLKGTAFFCMSERIAKVLSSREKRILYIAESPNESSLLSLLIQKKS